MEIYFYLVLWFFIFYLLFIIFYVFNFSRIAKWWWLPWVSAVGLVRESPRVPIAEAPATWSSCNIWGKMRKGGEDDDKGMVIVSLRVCGWDCFKIWEINKQIQMKWFLFFFKKKKIIWIDKLKLKNISILLF